MDKASDFESEDCEFESRRGRRLFAVAWPRNFGRRFLNSDPYSHGNVKVSTSFRSTNIRYLCKYFFLLPEMRNKMQSLYIFTSFVYLIVIWHYKCMYTFIGSDQPHSFRCRDIRRKLNARSWNRFSMESACRVRFRVLIFEKKTLFARNSRVRLRSSKMIAGTRALL
jgi:hypothetical protein